ncbi:MAG: succinylglutamate desuccinylase/aspartoacylase family protein [Bacteroidia bacterium]|nr:succinylglutamate desuccinylase/aspartoacylase family protein [Bacteroidia bacterium]
MICFAGMHGNETAGIRALELLFKMLEVEPITNESFNYRGQVVGIKGNLQAIDQGVRFVKKDLNRQWIKSNVDRICSKDPTTLEDEDLELFELHTLVQNEIEQYKPKSIIFLDLHTTTAEGGIFTIPHSDELSVSIAKDLFAPVLLGFLEGVSGTVLHYFNKHNFVFSKTVSLCFESGQHEDPLSVNRAIAALTNCMRAIGSVQQSDVAHRHNFLLQTYSKGLPPISNLIQRHIVRNGDGFQMLPGYQNFQMVKNGEHLATDKNGNIISPQDCRILMPLYQQQGEDGFFLIKDGI